MASMSLIVKPVRHHMHISVWRLLYWTEDAIGLRFCWCFRWQISLYLWSVFRWKDRQVVRYSNWRCSRRSGTWSSGIAIVLHLCCFLWLSGIGGDFGLVWSLLWLFWGVLFPRLAVRSQQQGCSLIFWNSLVVTSFLGATISQHMHHRLQLSKMLFLPVL